MITEAVHCDEPVDKVRKLIRKHQAVLVCDIPSGKRNNIVKYCYMYDKRAYAVSYTHLDVYKRQQL